MKKVIILSTVLTLLLSIKLHGQTLSFDSTFRHGILKNGLTYYVKNVPGASQVKMQMIVKSGFLNEKPDEIHLAHVLEHVVMMRCSDALDNLGLKAGLDWNATTGFEQTDYGFLIKSDTKSVEAGMGILENLLTHHSIDSAIVEQERGRVLNELIGKTVTESKFEHEKLMLLEDHPRYFVTSDEEIKSVKGFSLKTLRRFYERTYQFENQAIIIVGNVDENKIENQLIKHFQQITNSFTRVNGEKYNYQPKKKDRSFILINKKNDHITFDKFFNFKATKNVTVQDYRKNLMGDIFQFVLQNRFSDFSFAYRKSGLYAVYDYRNRAGRSNGWSSLHGSLELKKSLADLEIKRLLLEFFREEERLYELGVSMEELTDAKEILEERLRQQVFASIEYVVSKCTDHFIYGLFIPEPEAERALKLQLSSEITPKEMNDYIASFRTHEVALTIVDKQLKLRKVFSDKSIKKLISEARTSIHTPFVPSESKIVASDEEFKNLAGSRIVFSTTRIPEIGAVKCRSANGIEVIFKTLKPEVKNTEHIIITAFSTTNYLTPQSPNYASALIAPKVAMEVGQGDLYGDELEYSLAKMNMQFSMYFTPTFRGMQPTINAEIPLKKARVGLSIMRKFIISPKFNQQALNAILNGGRTEFQNNDVSSELVAKYSAPNDNLSRVIAGEVNINDVKQEYSRYFSSVNGFKIVVTGNYDLEETIFSVMVYFGSISSSQFSEPSREQTVVPSDSSDSYYLIEKQKSNTRISGYFFASHKLSNSEKMKILVLKSLLEEELFNKICKDNGLCYDAAASTIRLGRNLTMISFGLDFQDKETDSVRALTFETINNLRDSNNISESLAKAKLKVLAYLERRSLSHSFWQDYFINNYLNDEPIAQVTTWKSEVEKLTVEDIRKAARIYLSQSDLQVITVPD